MSQDYLDKLEHVRAAPWRTTSMKSKATSFPQLRQSADSTMQTRLTERYKDEYEKYVGLGE